MKHALSKRHTTDIFLTEIKTGPTWTGPPLRKIDALAIKPSWASPCITAYEVKVSRSDFMNDDKWTAYKDVSHRFYWACPVGLIKPEEVADDCGLVYYNPENGATSTKKKALFRDIPMPDMLLYYIVLSRLGDRERHPFFSSQREQIQAWVEDKERRAHLGTRFRSGLAKQAAEAQERIGDLEFQLKQAKPYEEKWFDLMRYLQPFGISHWNYRDEIAQRLTSGVSKELVNAVVRLVNQANAVAEMLNKAAGAKREAGD